MGAPVGGGAITPMAEQEVAMDIVDPRARGQRVKVVCFCNFDPEQNYDATYGHSILGNFYDLGKDGLSVEAPCDKNRAKKFKNAEAAFHALKYWALAGGFTRLSGLAATQKHRRLAEHADLTYAGFGSAWQAMLAVLVAKFGPESSASAALLETGDAFLLAHDPTAGHDSVWSDGCDGNGTNLLGMLLMLLRDRLSRCHTWSRFLCSVYDVEKGVPLHKAAQDDWQKLVRAATLTTQRFSAQTRR